MAEHPVERALRWRGRTCPGGGWAASAFRKRAHSIGVSVSEMTPETRMAALSVTANSWKSRPMSPPMNSSGMKTATSERLMEMTVNPICRAPLQAASSGVQPCSMKRKTFSMTTMASSTTKPTEIVTAMSERLSRL